MTQSLTSIPSGGGVGIMNFPRVAQPRGVVGIVIDLSDNWIIHHPYPFS